MEYLDEPIEKHGIGSVFKFEAWISLILLIVTLLAFKSAISEHLSGAEEMRFAPIKFFMLVICGVSFLILLINGARIDRDNIFLWFAFCYVLVGVFSTFFSGLYEMSALPFKFIRLSYWAWVLIISYYAVLHLKTLKFHVAVVVLLFPILYYFFLVMSQSDKDSSQLLLNPVFYISFLMPVILLLRSKLFKYGMLLMIFAAILISYKRSALLAFATSIPVYLYARISLGNSDKHKKLIPVLFGGVVLVLLLYVIFKFTSGALGLDWAARLEGMTADRGSGRLETYIGYLRLLSSQSVVQWIMGNGYNATEYTVYEWAHNDIIEVLYDFGLAGLTFYFLFIGQLAKVFIQMKKYKYKHFDAFAVSLVIFFWGTMFSMLISVPYWFLNLAFFWGWVIADFHNAQRSGDPEKIGNPLYACAYENIYEDGCDENVYADGYGNSVQ